MERVVEHSSEKNGAMNRSLRQRGKAMEKEENGREIKKKNLLSAYLVPGVLLPAFHPLTHLLLKHSGELLILSSFLEEECKDQRG